MVVSFGTMFNNLRLVRYDRTGTIEIERITVPLAYANKEKFYKRIQTDPELTKEVALTLPRMGFNLDSITYDPLRKTSLYNSQFAANSSNLKSLQATPYNFDFTLSVYVKTVEDGTQIIEQILPYFNPDYTLSININGFPNNQIDVPIVLNSVNQNVQADGFPDDTRVLTWDLSFTVKGYMYGPIADSKVIRNSQTNISLYNTSNTYVYKKLYLQNGSINYKIGELVYIGDNITSAKSSGYVHSWSPETNTLVLVDCDGQFDLGSIINGAVSGSSWEIQYTEDVDDVSVAIVIEPNPVTGNLTEDFGFTTNMIDGLTNVITVTKTSTDGEGPSPLPQTYVDGGTPSSF